jgi:hypothetical protein
MPWGTWVDLDIGPRVCPGARLNTADGLGVFRVEKIATFRGRLKRL